MATTATVATATPASSTIVNPDTIVNQAVTAVNPQGQTGTQINAAIGQWLENNANDPYTPAEIQEAEGNTGITGNGTWNSPTGPVSQWESQWENALDEVISPAQVMTPPNTTTPLVPLTPPPGTSSSGTTGSTTTTTPPATTTTSSTTSGGGTTTTPNPNSLLSLFQSYISSLPQNGGSSGSLDATGAGDVPGRSTPISSLGAITPIGTPTSTTSTGSPGLIIGVVVLGAAGVAIYFYEKHKKKTAKPSTPAPPKAA